jgi:hypothetical protein
MRRMHKRTGSTKFSSQSGLGSLPICHMGGRLKWRTANIIRASSRVGLSGKTGDAESFHASGERARCVEFHDAPPPIGVDTRMRHCTK